AASIAEVLRHIVGPGLGSKRGEQTLNVLPAAGTAGHVGHDPGEQTLRVVATEHRLYIQFDDREACLAAFVAITSAQHSSLDVLVPPNPRWPADRSASRSLRRASCSTL